jgi:hypothetical protein
MQSMGEMRPGGKLGLFFGQMAGLDFKPGFLQMTLFSQQYDIYPANPSPTITRALSFLLAPTARLVGYRSFYPEYAKRFLHRAAQQSADGSHDSAASESSAQPPASGATSSLPFDKLPAH